MEPQQSTFTPLKPVTLEDKPLFDRPCSACIVCPSVYNFILLYCWQESYGFQWFKYSDAVIVYDERDKVIFQPLGSCLDTEDLCKISDYLIAQGKSGDFMFITESFLGNHYNIHQFFHAEKDYDAADYIYVTDDLIELRGKKLHKKKNLISQFLRAYPHYSTEVLTQNDFNDCLELMKIWEAEKIAASEYVQFELQSLEKAFAHFDTLGLSGLGIRIDGKLIAFALYSGHTSSMAIVHYEKFDRTIKGAAQMINWETAKFLKGKYRFINREDDMGDPGLRQAKESYDPISKLVTYKLTRK